MKKRNLHCSPRAIQRSSMVSIKCDNNINQIAKATNITGVIYKKDIGYMREKIGKLSKEIWDIHSLLLRKK